MGAQPSKVDGAEGYDGPDIQLKPLTPLSKAESEAMAGIQKLGTVAEVEEEREPRSRRKGKAKMEEYSATSEEAEPYECEEEEEVDAATEPVVTVSWKIDHDETPAAPAFQISPYHVDSYYYPLPTNYGDTAPPALLGSPGQRAAKNRRLHQRPWSLKEVKALMEGIELCGEGHWSDIKKLHFNKSDHRTAVDLKDKWRNLIKASLLPRQKQKQEKPGGSGKQRWAPIPPAVLRRVRQVAAMQAEAAAAAAAQEAEEEAAEARAAATGRPSPSVAPVPKKPGRPPSGRPKDFHTMLSSASRGSSGSLAKELLPVGYKPRSLQEAADFFDFSGVAFKLPRGWCPVDSKAEASSKRGASTGSAGALKASKKGKPTDKTTKKAAPKRRASGKPSGTKRKRLSSV